MVRYPASTPGMHAQTCELYARWLLAAYFGPANVIGSHAVSNELGSIGSYGSIWSGQTSCFYYTLLIMRDIRLMNKSIAKCLLNFKSLKL